METTAVGGGCSVGVNAVAAGSVKANSVGVDLTRVVCVGIDSANVGGGVEVGVKAGSGTDVAVNRTAISVAGDAVTLKLSTAYRCRLSCNSNKIRMIVRMTATINLKRS